MMREIIIMLNNQRLMNLMTLGLLLLGTAPTIAQPIDNPSSQPNRNITRVLFKPPPEDQQPKDTQGAASRHGGQCSQDATPTSLADASSNQMSLKPLVPSSGFGLTLAERPLLWIDLPETSAKQVVLILKEEGKIHHSQTVIPITGQSGVISLQPSADEPPLEVGKAYLWAVVLLCGDRPSPNDPTITAWVRRINVSEPLKQGSFLEQAAWYGERGIWYEALTTLAQERQLQPNNQVLMGVWSDFLKSE